MPTELGMNFPLQYDYATTANTYATTTNTYATAVDLDLAEQMMTDAIQITRPVAYEWKDVVTREDLKKELDKFAHRIYEVISMARIIDITEKDFCDLLNNAK